MITLIVESHGERLGAVTVRATTKDKEFWFCDPRFGAAMVQVHDLIARALWPIGGVPNNVMAQPVEVVVEDVPLELPEVVEPIALLAPGEGEDVL